MADLIVTQFVFHKNVIWKLMNHSYAKWALEINYSMSETLLETNSMLVDWIKTHSCLMLKAKEKKRKTEKKKAFQLSHARWMWWLTACDQIVCFFFFCWYSWRPLVEQIVNAVIQKNDHPILHSFLISQCKENTDETCDERNHGVLLFFERKAVCVLWARTQVKRINYEEPPEGC